MPEIVNPHDRFFKRMFSNEDTARDFLRLWEHTVREGQHLWPIFPVVIYHGARRWRVSEAFHDLIEVPEALKAFVPSYRYWLCDLSRLSDGEIRGGVLL